MNHILDRSLQRPPYPTGTITICQICGEKIKAVHFQKSKLHGSHDMWIHLEDVKKGWHYPAAYPKSYGRL